MATIVVEDVYVVVAQAVSFNQISTKLPYIFKYEYINQLDQIHENGYI